METTTKGDKVKLRIEAKLENLSVISSVISAAMEQAHIDASVIPKVLLAVDEACTNIVLYAYQERKGYIRLACGLDGDDFVVSIQDKGKPFNPCLVPVPELDTSLEDRRAGGLGVYLMRTFMDEISYTYDPKTGNQLVMRKRLPKSTSLP